MASYIVLNRTIRKPKKETVFSNWGKRVLYVFLHFEDVVNFSYSVSRYFLILFLILCWVLMLSDLVVIHFPNDSRSQFVSFHFIQSAQKL